MKRLILLIVIVTLAVCSYPAYANEWIACAGENQSCIVPGTKMVRYGTGDRWAMKKATNRISCSNSVFGDPAPGAGKACYYQDSQPSDKEFRQPSGHDDSRQDRGVRSGHDNRPQDSWVRCANEGGYCKFHGQRDIRYGAGGRWNYQSAMNSISCNNDVFGDPAPGAGKACYYQDSQPSDKGFRQPSGHDDSRQDRGVRSGHDNRPQDRWVRCANEGGYCKFHGQRDIRYGAGDRWNYQSAMNSISCNNDVFGDPAPGAGKACYYQDSQPSDKGFRQPSGHDNRRQDRWVRCANEGGYCKFHGQRDIRYGAGDRWNYQSARNSISCNNGIFGDPAPGVGKACYYQE